MKYNLRFINVKILALIVFLCSGQVIRWLSPIPNNIEEKVEKTAIQCSFNAFDTVPSFLLFVPFQIIVAAFDFITDIYIVVGYCIKQIRNIQISYKSFYK